MANFVDGNNVVREIKAPVKIDCFDYDSELNLIVALHLYENYASIWNRDTGEIVQQISMDGYEFSHDILFLPEGCIGVVHGSFEQENHGVAVFSIDSGEHVFDVLAHHNLSDEKVSRKCEAAALTHHNKLITGNGLEYTIDFKKKQILKKRVVYECEEQKEVTTMCCAKNSYTIYYNAACTSGITCVEVLEADQDENTRSGIESVRAVTNKYTIEHCDNIRNNRIYAISIQHDGEHIIIEVQGEIYAMKADSEGNYKAYCINREYWTSCDYYCCEGSTIKLAGQGQLMLCYGEGDDVIKLFEYKMPTTLLGLCRLCINNTLNNNADKVKCLPVSSVMKNYLLYKARVSS